MRDALLGVSFDPRALILAPLALAVTAFLAVTLPVLRAASVDPMIVLRDE
jgi:ABC-type lipoprotein release transport system permease subunit